MGSIERITGPLVVAKDMLGSRIYDIVRVGEANIIGEIIQLTGDKAIIQVYEDATGLRPGEPVKSLGMPFSVELGPGMIGKIFDGMQRPLETIQAKAGPFITRGIAVQRLDHRAKWKFVPSKEMKKGKEVKEGEILGYVDETKLVRHYVLVPKGISGRIESIKEGIYTVNEPIAEIKLQNGKQAKITMSQERPVREPAKIKRRLPVEEPLVTGQRVIDTLFPVAKGGTAAIPGPFGSGKCVTGDTPVMLADGRIEAIESLFAKAAANGIVEKDGDETWVFASALGTFSLKDGRLTRSETRIFYKGKSDSVIRIKTAHGRVVKVTPIHKLFKVENGMLKEVMAKDLKAGDYIAAIKKLPENRANKSIKIGSKVLQVDSRLAELLAYLSLARLENGQVKISLSKELLERFIAIAESLFGARCEGGSTSNKEIIELARLASKGMPEAVMGSSNESIASFIGAYFATLGKVDDGRVEIRARNEWDKVKISYALTRLGVMHTLGDAKVSIEDNEGLEALAHILAMHRFDAKAIEQLRIKAGMASFAKSRQYVNLGGELQIIESAEPDCLPDLEDIYPDKIEEIEELRGPFEVYDLSLPEYGSNFVGGIGGLLLHNTVTQHEIAKWCNADIIIYCGIGERGNEMAEVLNEFPKLKDPKSGEPLLNRTILIANTSNMPVAAREISIYTSVTIAEYFRDMGYDVAIMADSTSRWAEAMREISARLEEMPGEEGYPAYLPKRLSEFYERAGKAETLSGKQGSVTIIGAVSPPGGDLTEPVTQATLRLVKTFWSLDASLASARHFPAINWLNSYSLYMPALEKWFVNNIDKDWIKARERTLKLLQQEAELRDIVQLVGEEALPNQQRAVLEIGKMLREHYLRQNAYDPIDEYTSMKKQKLMLYAMLRFADKMLEAIGKGVQTKDIVRLDSMQEIARLKEVPEKELEAKIEALYKQMDQEFEKLEKEKEVSA